MERRPPKRLPPRERLPRRRAWLVVGLAATLVLEGAAFRGGARPAVPGAHAPRARPARAAAPEGLVSVLRRANPSLDPGEALRIAEAVLRYSAKYALDPELVAAILLVESAAQPGAVSPKGARGLMQVMPYMVRPMALAGNLSTIETNVEAGCIILADNIRRLGEAGGISAYFWGSEIRGGAYLERVRAARARLGTDLTL
jgi:hypothetical protein